MNGVANYFPNGPRARKEAVDAFIARLEGNDRPKYDKLGVKVSFSVARSFWDRYRLENPLATEKEIRALQRQIASVKKRVNRAKNQRKWEAASG